MNSLCKTVTIAFIISILYNYANCQTTFSGHWLAAADSVFRPDIKSVQLYCSGAEMDFPVLTMGQPARLTFEMDLLKPEAETLEWYIIHCDRHWNPDNLKPNEFMTGLASGTLDEYDYSFNTRKDYVHYQAQLPGEFTTFIHSGNYLLVVAAYDDDGNEGDVLLKKRFCVSEAAVNIQAEAIFPYDGMDRDCRQEVDVVVGSRSVALNDQWMAVVVQQNGRIDNMRLLQHNGYSGQGLAYRYRQENIFWGGNTFRYFDCSNLHASMYHVDRVEEYGGEVMAFLKPDEDRSRKVFVGDEALNGGMKVNVWDRSRPNLEAEYVWVGFMLPSAKPILEGEVHLMGALTDWHLDSTSRMDYDPSLKAYTKRLLLKQGYYSYQLLLDGPHTQLPFSKTARLEGDHRETRNDYTIFVYYQSPADRADRLLATQRIRP